MDLPPMRNIFEIRYPRFFALAAALILLSNSSCSDGQSPTDQAYLYLGQPSPGSTPQLFSPGILSTPEYENCMTFLPDGMEIYYTSGSWREASTILFSRYDGRQWSSPEVASFSGEYKDAFPFISPDGKRLFFVSNRPIQPDQSIIDDQDIWVVERIGTGWSTPAHLGDGVNTSERETSPSTTKAGRLYFARYENEEANIYYADAAEGLFGTALKLSAPVSTGLYETYPFIDPDERFLLLSIWRHPEGIGEALFLFFNT